MVAMTDSPARTPAAGQAGAPGKKPLFTARTKSKIIDFLFVLPALALLALSYLKLATGSFNPFIYFQF